MSFTLNNYKLSCELLGHSMDVRSVCSAAQVEGGQMLASGSRDKSVKMWRPIANGYVESVTLKDHENFIACVYFHEAERWLCTGSNDATICIYLEDGLIPIMKLKGHSDTVCSIFSGLAERTLITGSWDKTARVWTIDEKGDSNSIILKGHEAAVWAVTSMTEVHKYVTGSADRNIYYWSSKGEKLHILKGHTDCVRGVLGLGNGYLVSCANDATLRCWNDEGECVKALSGHTNYVYALAQNKALGEHCVLSCGEDSTLRMWDISTGEEKGEPLLHPTQSVWSVACLSNGDIVTGSSDGAVRVFTKDVDRFANEVALATYDAVVDSRKSQMMEEFGGIKKSDLPGPESLLENGKREGQTKMVRHIDGTVKCYMWEVNQWKLIGDITGASGGSQNTSGKILYEGKEYDYVFSVDISDSGPPLKLPYNLSEDPWHSAQQFIHRHSLPQAYLEQIANFIINNSKKTNQASTPSANSEFRDPFTGSNSYVPRSTSSNFQASGNVDPFTSSGSYSTTQSGKETHFPVKNYLIFDTCDPVKVLEKLKEFNRKLPNAEQLEGSVLEIVIKLTENPPDVNSTAIDALQNMLKWPSDYLFPVIDIVRLGMRWEDFFILMNSLELWDLILPKITTLPPNQLMIVRCLVNMQSHSAGRRKVDEQLPTLVRCINKIQSGSSNLQIAIATFFLNLTVTQILQTADNDKCHIITEGLIQFFKWVLDLEACYRSMQAIGNLTKTTFAQETTALLISVDYVMKKITEMTNTTQTENFKKINTIGTALLAAF